MDGMKGAVQAVRDGMIEVSEKLEAHMSESQPAPEAAPLPDSGEKPEGGAAPLTDSGESEASLPELQTENKTLKDQVAVLQSETHSRRMLQDWLRGLSPEGFIRLGTNLGYGDLLSDAVMGEDPDNLHEVALSDAEGGGKVLFSEVLPEGEDGWMRSETLGCYVKVQ